MSSTLPNADIFTRISDSSEKARLFSDLAVTRSEILAKKLEPGADVFVLLAYEFSNQKLLCKLTGATQPMPQAGELVLTFFVGGEKYFQQAQYTLQADIVSITTAEHVFHLQRREDYRIKLPGLYKALLEMVSINGKTQKHSIPIMDLSGGGCRIQVDAKFLSLKVHDELRGHLFLPDRDPIPITGSIRHVRVENHGKGPLTCGIQFIGLTEPVKNRIIAVVMDLYRQLFAGRNS
jgi:c-di-GMP-binding flagellar brake protein YcgR